MSDISAIGKNIPVKYSAPSSKPVESKETAPVAEKGDSISISGGIKTAGKALLGTGIAAVAAPIAALGGAVDGSRNAARQGLGVEGKQDTFSGKFRQACITASTFVGALSGLSAGPLGALAGAIVAPGIMGSLFAGSDGLVEGAKSGIQLTKKAAYKVEEKVANKAGNFLGKAAKFTTAAALGAVAVPGLALINTAIKGIDFAKTAIGVNKNPETTGDKISSAVKEGTVIYGYVSGFLSSSPGIIPAITGGITGAGGLATGAAGIREGVENAVDITKSSYKLAGKLIDGK